MEATVIVTGIPEAAFWEKMREMVREEAKRLVQPEQPGDLLSYEDIEYIYNVAPVTISKKINAANVVTEKKGVYNYIRRDVAETLFRRRVAG